MRLISMIYILLLGCGAKSSQDDSYNVNLGAVKAKRDYLVANFNLGNIERCDRVTFYSFFGAFGDSSVSLDKFESPSGKFNRDAEPCFPEDSKSETSLDGYLGVLHWLFTKHDLAGVHRIIDYALPNDWITGEGPTGVTSILPLTPLIYKMIGALAVKGESDALPFIGGFRSHLTAMYIWLNGRISGEISALELKVLEGLALMEPRSPIFNALYHRFSDGQYQAAVNLLDNMPSPYSDLWGSCPDDLAYILTVAIMEGN